MKTIFFATLAFTSLSATILTAAIPVIAPTPVHSIDALSIAAPATGDAFVGAAAYDETNDKLYFVAFNTKRVGVITNPSNSASTASIFAHTSSTDPVTPGPVVWGGSRGLQNVKVNQANGNVLVSGDQGTNGAILLYDTAGALVDSVFDTSQVGAANRRTAGADFFGTGFVFVETVSKKVVATNASLDLVDESAALTADFLRSVAVIGDNVYLGAAGASNPEEILLYSGGTAGSVAGYSLSATPFFSYPVAVGSAVRWSVTPWDFEGTSYLLITDASNGVISVIDELTGTVTTQLTINAGVGGVVAGGVVGAKIAGQNYLFVTQNAGSTAAEVAAYTVSVDSATSDWNLYSF